ncbi:DinB family protein [Microvirga sp. STR05]|uniref:DinB family protein n=1 Tax=Hymenobacter duratus TaxID=2771356 RepID=A0ABR8JIY3_9BACT|nr:DinB family protein [Hymenobacter duratus]MBD2714474.1 DinB family protein [Hymenobacter duratus]MBR7949378.1 DinB family protein [Microvirga sp. STR05]
MRETQRIADQLRRAFDGDAWSGPSLQATLAGTSAAQAAAHPLAGVHSIGELVRHLTTWAGTVAWRVEQQQQTPLTNEDWPAFATEPDERQWQLVQQELQSAHQRLLAATEALNDASLETRVLQADGSQVTLYVLLHGSAQHYLYHAGQIALLRKFL